MLNLFEASDTSDGSVEHLNSGSSDPGFSLPLGVETSNVTESSGFVPNVSSVVLRLNQNVVDD